MQHVRPYILACLIVVGCGDGPIVGPVTGPVPRTLRSASEQLLLGGIPLRLETYLWRDFMPIAPPDGQPLIAVLQITTVDSTAFPVGVRADAAWIIYGEQAWSTPITEERSRAPEAPTLEVVARGGPKWGPKIEVDVVVQLRDGQGKGHWLQARRQYIHRTE